MTISLLYSLAQERQTFLGAELLEVDSILNLKLKQTEAKANKLKQVALGKVAH
jgi:hypothetical protein